MRRLAAVWLALAAAGCASVGQPRPAFPVAPPQANAAPASTRGVGGVADLPGWAQEDHRAALEAFRAGCPVSTDPALGPACREAKALAGADDAAARRFFETRFRPEVAPGSGLLTAYFAPEYPARAEPDAVFSAALRPRPDDLVLAPPGPDDPPGRKVPRLSFGGELLAYPDRAGIELTPPVQALAWMRPEDLFFLQIQGSGGLAFPDGRRLKAVYAADNGRAFVPVARNMVRQGLLTPERASGGSIRAWLAEHRGSQAQAVMDLDPRYVFFSLLPDDGRDPTGAAGVLLPPGRAIAIDPAFHRYGEPCWIDAVSPVLAGAVPRYRRLVIALDTGSAIRGDVRADLYLGRGEAAGLEAGRVRHNLLLVRLVPVGRR